MWDVCLQCVVSGRWDSWLDVLGGNGVEHWDTEALGESGTIVVNE